MSDISTENLCRILRVIWQHAVHQHHAISSNRRFLSAVSCKRAEWAVVLPRAVEGGYVVLYQLLGCNVVVDYD